MEKTMEILQRHFYWPGMVTQVREFMRGCEVCKELKALNFRMHFGIGEREQPFQKQYIDFLGKYPRSEKGHVWISIVVNHFFEFTFL